MFPDRDGKTWICWVIHIHDLQIGFYLHFSKKKKDGVQSIFSDRTVSCWFWQLVIIKSWFFKGSKLQFHRIAHFCSSVGKKRKSQTHPNVHIKYMYLSEANIQLIKHHDSFITFGNIDQYENENPYFYSKKCFSFVYIDVILFGWHSLHRPILI